MTKTLKKYVWIHSNTQDTKVILAVSEYRATMDNFGNLAGYKYSHSLPLNK